MAERHVPHAGFRRRAIEGWRRRARASPRGTSDALARGDSHRRGEANIPDFLDNHDSGDVGGDGALASLLGAVGSNGTIWWPGPFTRYCVEVLNTTVANTTTTTFESSPVASPYADYVSTNPPWTLPSFNPQYAEYTQGAEYWSYCDLLGDRYFGHQTRATILAAACNTNASSPSFDPYMICRCSAESASASREFTGMMPIGLPISLSSPVVPGVYPGSLPGFSVGRWFSHPARGRCPLGARVGDGGCTWQRAPVAHSIYWEELRALGWNTTGSMEVPIPGKQQPISQTLGNVEIFKRAWRAKKLPPCGEVRGGGGVGSW